MDIFDGFLFLIFPDRVFRSIVSKARPYDVFLSLLVSCTVFVSLLTWMVRMKMPQLVFPWQYIFLAAIFCYCSLVVFSAAISFMTDWIYVTFLSARKLKPEHDFLNNFLCRTLTLPFLAFLLYMHVLFYENIAGGPLLFLVCILLLRILDVQARLIKLVYHVRLIQGYTLVFINTVFFSLGMFLAAKISSFLLVH